jgi:hypothetical protein
VPSYFLALRKKIRHLGRKHKSTTVVSLDKLDNDLRGLVGLVLMEEVAGCREDLELEFACSILDITYEDSAGGKHTLHLPNHQFFVQSIRAS